MKIIKLELKNFRNFKDFSIVFSKQKTLLVAPNTYGKTNLLEAMFYGAIGRSFKAELERETIHNDEEFSDVNLMVNSREEGILLRIFLQKGESDTQVKKRLEVNNVSRKLFNFLGQFRAVLFSPEDLNLIADSPSQRRKYLDTVLSSISPSYYRNLNQYQKVIVQRNRLLHRIREGQQEREQLFYWNEKILNLGIKIYNERKKSLSYLSDEMKITGQKIHINAYDLEIVYLPSLISPERLKRYEDRDIESAQSLIGPHRDDFKLFWMGHDLAKYGSRGEQRLGILALKMAEINFLEKMTGERPVLLLDDVFSELDVRHCELIFPLFDHQQTVITATDKHRLSKDLLEDFQIIDLTVIDQKS